VRLGFVFTGLVCAHVGGKGVAPAVRPGAGWVVRG
jgi:hypothetical protein